MSALMGNGKRNSSAGVSKKKDVWVLKVGTSDQVWSKMGRVGIEKKKEEEFSGQGASREGEKMPWVWRRKD